MTDNIQDPWLNKIINYELKNNNQIKKCPVCTYENLPSDTNCRICLDLENLTNQKLFQNKITKKSLSENDKRKIVRETRRQEKFEKFKKRLVKSSAKIYVAIVNCKEQLLALWLSCQLNTRKSIILAFSTFLTLLILAFGLNSMLTEHTPNHEVSQTKRETPVISQTDKKLDEDTPLPKAARKTVSMAKGLFSYAGSPFGDHLVSEEFVRAIESAHPNLKWRNTKSSDGNDDSSTSIKRLIDGDLTIAFNNRALNDLEIKRAGLRGITLRQTPIAIDGLVFFANKNISIPANLNLEQIEKIYRGKIKNWNQINFHAGNIPIAPIFQNFESLNVLGLDLSEVSPLIQHIPNYDRLIKKVISTPGGFSFISASLISEQKSIKVFNLADSNSSKYVPAFIKGSPNLNAFRSGNYPLTRKIFMAHKEGDAWEQNAGEAYVSFLNTQGQKLIEKSGFVPLRQF